MATRSANIRYREHLFYTSLAAVFTLTVFVGFSRTYYVHQATHKVDSSGYRTRFKVKDTSL